MTVCTQTLKRTTEALVSGTFDQPVELKVYPSLEKQKGNMDCGVYCIAVCASLLHRTSMNFSQSLLRPKLVSCLRTFMFHFSHASRQFIIFLKCSHFYSHLMCIYIIHNS